MHADTKIAIERWLAVADYSWTRVENVPSNTAFLSRC